MDGGSKEHDEAILSGLSTLIQLLANERFKHFQAVLDTYIREHFSHTLAAVRLVSLITRRIETRITHVQFAAAQSDVSDRYAGKFTQNLSIFPIPVFMCHLMHDKPVLMVCIEKGMCRFFP